MHYIATAKGQSEIRYSIFCILYHTQITHITIEALLYIYIKYFSNFCVEDPNILSDHCVVKFMSAFCVSYEKVEESVSNCTYNMTQDTCVTHECNGRYVWDNNKIGDFLVKLQSEEVKQQLYVLNNNIQ